MLSILHLEDCATDAVLIEHALQSNGIHAKFTVVQKHSDFLAKLDGNKFDLILADNGLPGFNGLDALKLVREKFPGLAWICVSGAAREEQAFNYLNAGATDYVLKDQVWNLVAAVRRAQERLQQLRVNEELEQRVKDLTAQLQAAKR
jgi:hypothetical protein